jgi:hypothetical protein
MKYILIILLFVISNCTPKQLQKSSTEIHDSYYDSLSVDFRQIKDFDKIAYLNTSYRLLIECKYSHIGFTTVLKVSDSLNNKDSFILIPDTLERTLNKLNIIDSIGLLTNLRHLNIGGYTTKTIVFPQSLNNLKKLEDLSIWFYINDTTFPNDIVLPNLKYLTLGSIRCSSFPTVFYNWDNVRNVSYYLDRKDRHLFRVYIIGFSKMKNMKFIQFSIDLENDREVLIKDLDKYWRRDIRWAKRFLKNEKLSLNFFNLNRWLLISLNYS